MSKKSGIQMIEDIAEHISILDKRFTIVEQMMKQLLNKSNVGNKISMSTPTVEKKVSPKIGDPPVKEIPPSKTKVIGTIKNKEGRMVYGVSIKIYDENNKLVKSTKTNKAGSWMSFLPSGKYKAEYYLEGKINENMDFKIEEGQTLLRMAQPKLEG